MGQDYRPRVSKGIDAGAMASLIESAKPDSEVGYVMYEPFFQQTHWYLDYTNDTSVRQELLPILESSIERSVRRLKPGKEWLFENSLNTWISDSHWSIEGQCTQSSALTYHMMTLAAMLETDEEKKKAYTEKAEAVRHDLHDVLWQKRKGTFAYCRDLRGNGLLHGEPELADIYHTAECGLVTPTECYHMQCGGCLYIRPVKLYIRGEKEHRKFLPPSVFSENPAFHTVPMWDLMNASSPRKVLDTVAKTTPAPPEAYSQTNYWYYLEHLDARTRLTPGEEVSDDRWRSLAAEHETVMTGEGIPFLSAGSGKYLSAVSVSAAGYPDSVTVPVEDTGLCLYLLLTGITFPMQSHVENLRVTITYRDGETEEYPLVNPFDICDGWSNLWGRFHDSPGCGFENLRGKQGVLSSAGQNLCKAIPTDTEAEILSFPLRKKPVSAVTVRAVANDIVYCLMGVTVLRDTNENK